MVQQAISLLNDSNKGSVRVAGTGVPSGHVTITRSSSRENPAIIRNGEFDLTTGGFIRQDTDVPYGVPITYRATVTGLLSRLIQTNRVLNPKAKNNANNWATATGRVLTQETSAALAPPRDATTSLKISANSGGANGGTISDRLIASTTPSGFGPGDWYVSGQLRFNNADLWLWNDAKTAGTWQTVKNRGTWQQVKSASAEGAGAAYTALWVAAASPTGASTETRRNICLNPSFETNLTGWAAAGGTATVARSTEQAFTGTNSLKTTLAAGGAITGGAVSTVSGFTIGQVYTVSAYLYVPSGSVSAAPSLMISGGLGAAPAVTTANTWVRSSVTWTATAASHDILLVNGAAASGGQPFYTDAVLIEKASTAGSYFDGSTTPAGSFSYAWAGTAHASASIQTTSDLTLFGNPVQLLGLPSDAGATWRTFSGTLTVPVGAPANTRLVFYHGTQIREYANTWWLTTLMITPTTEVGSGALIYLDGDTPLPANPAENLIPGSDWKPVTADSSIVWNGTPNNSVSVYTGPSGVTAEAVTLVPAPDMKTLKVKAPVLLSDPVTSSLGMWFELLGIGTLSFKERADLYDVLGRGPQIAVSQMRAWASGQLSLLTYTLDQIPVVERLFASGRILLLRNPDPRYPESDWYLHIGEVGQDRLGGDLSRPERAWTVPFVRVERPVGLIEGSAGTTWAQAKAGYSSWSDARDKRTDWLAGALVTPS